MKRTAQMIKLNLTMAVGIRFLEIIRLWRNNFLPWWFLFVGRAYLAPLPVSW